MLTKEFQGHTSGNAQTAMTDSRDKEVFSLLVNFKVGRVDTAEMNELVARIVGDIPQTSEELNARWKHARAPLLRDKADAVIDLGETMAHVYAHAIATYLHPSQKHVDSVGVDARYTMDRNLHDAQRISKGAVTEMCRTNTHLDLAGAMDDRLQNNLLLAAIPYVGADTERARNDIAANHHETYATALAATARVMETDLAFFVANIVHFNRLKTVKVDHMLEELRDMYAIGGAAGAKDRITSHPLDQLRDTVRSRVKKAPDGLHYN